MTPFCKVHVDVTPQFGTPPQYLTGDIIAEKNFETHLQLRRVRNAKCIKSHLTSNNKVVNRKVKPRPKRLPSKIGRY